MFGVTEYEAGRGRQKKRTPIYPHDLPGFNMLAIDGVQGIADLVEDMHGRIAGFKAGQPGRGVVGLAYDSIRVITGLIWSINATIAQVTPPLDEKNSTPEREAMLAILNGVLGDSLEATKNPLAITMSFRQNGKSLKLTPHGLAAAIPNPSRKLMVLVHGLCRNDLQWEYQGDDYGAALARDLGYTPVYLYYNSGLHISTNGRIFSEKLNDLVGSWPVPIDELVILSHSLGGLIARSACHIAAAENLPWLSALRKLIFLGTPHHGSPLERSGVWLQFVLGNNAYTAPFNRLGRIRSAGITDMRYGNLLDEDWMGQDRFARMHDLRSGVPLPEGVACYTIAAALCSRADGTVSALIGDGLVQLDSALGNHTDLDCDLAFPEANRWVGYRMSHMDLIRNREVYSRIQSWLEE